MVQHKKHRQQASPDTLKGEINGDESVAIKIGIFQPGKQTICTNQ
tara:strand:+ start:975 stop:1109 length:135 start_codon:yes stop_codon:yes gene_type:complete